MLEIINYREADHYGKVRSWWIQAGEIHPSRAQMPEESTFIVEAKGKPWICVTIYLTNSADIAWVDNLIADPEMPGGEARKAAITWLQKFLETWAFKKGYSKLLCMADKPALAQRYRDLGYRSTLKNVETFVKDLKES